MDVISYGVANKVSKDEKKTRNVTLASGVQGSFPDVRSRIDTLDLSIEGAVRQANKLILQDTVNIMKAHAKLNSIAKTKKYRMLNMVFEDFLDNTGIEAAQSQNFKHDAVNGLVEMLAGGGTVITTAETADVQPDKAVLTVETVKKGGADQGVSMIPVMLSPNEPSPYVVSSNHSAQLLALFDKDDSTIFYGGGSNTLITVDMGAPIQIDGYAFTTATYSTSKPRIFSLEGSNDNSTWVALDNQSISPTLSDNTRYQYNILSPKQFRYYKFYIISNSSTTRVTLREFELLQINRSPVIYGNFYISRDDGVNWEEIIPEQLFYFSKGAGGKKIRLKIEAEEGVQILNYGLTWS